MSLTADSPAHSSSSDDLAAFLDAELETASGTSSELEDVEAGVEEGEEEGKDDEQYEDENEDWGEDGDGKDDSDATRYLKSILLFNWFWILKNCDWKDASKCMKRN